MAPKPTLDPALLEPPDDAAVKRALTEFVAAVRRHYGDRLRSLYLFGSRARGDHTPDSDADVAVVLADGGWRVWDEKMVLCDLSYQMLLTDGVYIQTGPIAESAWKSPDTHHNPYLVRAMRREGRALDHAAF